MAGIGVRLNKLFRKGSITSGLAGVVYGSCLTVTPMVLVIVVLLLTQWLLGFRTLDYYSRALFSSTFLYIFIFGLLSAAPFNSVLSKYMQDAIFEERYQDILPCYYVGLTLNVLFSCLMGVPFCLWEHFVGQVPLGYVFTGFCGFISIVLVFYSMIYLSICKDYGRISIFFLVGMTFSFVLSLILHFLAGWEATRSMLFAFAAGFFLIAVLEFGSVRRYFVGNSNRFRPVLRYFRQYWHLVVTYIAYTLGLYIHNFVFWNTDMRMIVARSFVSNQSYDMASCLALFTNISATVIFIARVEMFFHDRYKAYSEAVIGGRLSDIQNTKRQVFREVANQLMDLARLQFIISVAAYLIFMVVMPRVGFAGLVVKIYPCMAAGYFILFQMYAEILFLYYFKDAWGAVFTSVSFCLVTLLTSIVATHLPPIWYGIGVVIGSFVGWSVGYFRLRWTERHMDRQVFCQGDLISQGKGPRPTDLVYQRAREQE